MIHYNLDIKTDMEPVLDEMSGICYLPFTNIHIDIDKLIAVAKVKSRMGEHSWDNELHLIFQIHDVIAINHSYDLLREPEEKILAVWKRWKAIKATRQWLSANS